MPSCWYGMSGGHCGAWAAAPFVEAGFVGLLQHNAHALGKTNDRTPGDSVLCCRCGLLQATQTAARLRSRGVSIPPNMNAHTSSLQPMELGRGSGGTQDDAHALIQALIILRHLSSG